MALVHEANWARDKAEWTRAKEDWHAAEQAYAAALALYPFERSYWVLHGHALKEQGDLAGAEISYRTACANGEPVQDVGVHLRFVMQHNGVDEQDYPIRAFRPTLVQDQLPGKADGHQVSSEQDHRAIQEDHHHSDPHGVGPNAL